MRKYIINFVKHPLIIGSTIIFIGSFAANIGNYFFNLILGRFLFVTDYGIYSSLISFLALFGIFPSAFTTIFAKFAAAYGVRKKDENLNSLLVNGFRIILLLSIGVFIILTFFVSYIGNFLHIQDIKLLFIIFLIISVSILSSLPFGILQGEMRFYLLSFFNIFTPLLKIALGFIFLFLGLKVLGVTLAILFASIIPVIFIFFLFWRRYKKPTKSLLDKSIFFREFKNHSFKFFLATLGLTILTSADVMLVKHFFRPEEAGQYAALSLMGKSIFYLASPIYFVFFPLIAQKQEKNESLHGTLLLAAFIITMCSVILSFVYFLFPHIILNVFFPAKEYSILTSYLGPFSIYIIVFSNATLFNNFLLSIGKSGIYITNLLVAFIFVLFFYFFHSSFYQVITILFVTSFLLLALHLLYYILTIKKITKKS